MDKLKDTVDVFRSNGARKTLILCNKEMLRLGYTHDVINALLAKSINYSLFSDTLTLPKNHAVQACMEQLISERIDSIIAVGDKDVLEIHKTLLDSIEQPFMAKDIEINVS